MTKPANRIPVGDLLATIDDFIKVFPRTTAELAKLTGYDSSTCRTRLLVLEERGLIYKIGERSSSGMGMTYIWHPGPAPAKRPVAEPVRKPVLGEMPRRIIRDTYPNIGRRDSLVAALFGPAGARP